jgi:pimeloyl-ACP methyl ester carboxylesterase
LLLTVLAAPGVGLASELPEVVSFPTKDGGRINAHSYGDGPHAVVLAHGKVFDKESWQVLAGQLSKEGLRVLALDFRGYGRSTPGKEEKALWLDVLGAADYLRQLGAQRVSALGASMGGGAVGRASVSSPEGTFDKLILLAAAPIADPDRMKAGAFLFIVSREERLLPRVKQQFELAPEPKRLEILEGSAHAQHVFRTDRAEALTKLIVDFLAN